MDEDGKSENCLQTTKDSDRQLRLRLCVLNEILNTERDYVGTMLFLQSKTPLLSPAALGIVCFIYCTSVTVTNANHHESNPGVLDQKAFLTDDVLLLLLGSRLTAVSKMDVS
ncbi:UNVERIFIED_CONTAM: hypothetical protein FKN15_041380 [Acipenser sinensis]